MALKEQRWTPDTCANPAAGDACVWIEEWDDEVPAESRTHSLIRRERACSWHAVETPATGYVRCYAENRRKNVSFSISQQVRSTIRLEEFRWQLSPEGVLTVDFGAAMTAGQKLQVQAAADVQFGPGKVVIR